MSGAERTALIDHDVRAFCLAGGNLRAADMAQLYLDVIDEIAAACAAPVRSCSL